MINTSKKSTIARSAALMFAATAGTLTLGQTVAHAQAATFPDVPANHWAYQAVQDLADKGLVKGYPNGEFLGNRTLTRYEFATVIDRMLQTIADMKSAPTTAPTPAPVTPQVTQDDLNKLQVLMDQFRTELTAVQTDVKKAQDDIDAIRQDILDTKDIAGKALDTANNSYGVGSKRKFAISGYIQTRYFAADKSTLSNYPNGTAAANSAYNGNYLQGGSSGSFNVRRSRLKFTGTLTGNTKYAIQLDASGATTPGGAAVSVREGNVSYTFGDGSEKYPTLTAGLFTVPFGYMLPLSSSATLSAERPLAFNEGSAGLFASQDYDRGAQLAYTNSGIKVIAAFINGTGLTSNDVDRQVDQVYHAGYQFKSQPIGIGVSYYDGHITGTGTGVTYKTGKRELTGFDAQYISPSGPFLLGEYLSGKYESLSFFPTPTATKVTTINPAVGNKVEGYYIQGGYTHGFSGAHPLTFAVSFDELNRSKSGLADSGSSYKDTNLGYGVLYNLDKATRVRLWYTKPQDVAHPSAVAEPQKIGLFTGELQVKF